MNDAFLGMIMSPGNKAWKKLGDTFGHIWIHDTFTRSNCKLLGGKDDTHDCNRKRLYI